MYMTFRRVAKLIGAAGLGFALQACVVRSTPVNSGYGYYGQAGVRANVTVGTPSAYYVSSMPPQPLYESMSPCLFTSSR